MPHDRDASSADGVPNGLRIGFLGAGLIATYHSKSLRRSGAEAEHGVIRAGVYDPDTARAEAFAKASGHVVCGSEDEVLDGCDAVYVCTWTSEHPRQVARAVERGLHVFCEKPLATSLAAAEAMAAAANAAGITHQVGLILRRSPAYLWARHLTAEATAGRLMTITFRDDQYIPIQGQYGSTWRADKDLAGAGALLEHSIHDVDMLRFLVGDMARVSAHQSNFHGYAGVEDAVTASIAFADGSLGSLTTVWHDNLARPSLRRVEMFCERRYIVIDGDDWYGPVTWTDSDGSENSLTGEDLVVAAEQLVDGSLNPDGEFVRAVVAARPAWPDLNTAVEAHRVVDAMYASAREHGAPRTITQRGRLTEVVEITTADTYALRRAVLRRGDPDRPVNFDEDDLPGAFHLGVRDSRGSVVATSTWTPRMIAEFPNANAIQLRGMATAANLQGIGIGGALLEAGAERCAAAGFELMWARARDAALAFYERHQCHVVGNGFVDPVTQMPHHVVVRELFGSGGD